MKKIKKKKRKKMPDFGQPTNLIAWGRASATLPAVLHSVVVVRTGTTNVLQPQAFLQSTRKA